MENLLRDAISNQLVQLFIAGVISVALILANRLIKWGLSPPQLIVYALWLFLGVIVFFNQMAFEPSLRTKIREWLDSPTYSVRPADHESGFGFVVTDRQGKSIQISETDPTITINTGVGLSDELKGRFLRLSEQEKEHVIADLKIELLRIQMGYQNLGFNLHEGVVLSTEITVTRETLRVDFFKTLFFIRGGRDFFLELLKKGIGQFDEVSS